MTVPRDAGPRSCWEVRHRECSTLLSGAHRIGRSFRMSADCQTARSLLGRSRRRRSAAPGRRTPAARLPAARAGHRYAEPRLTVAPSRRSLGTPGQRSGNRRPFCIAVRCFCQHTGTLISSRQSAPIPAMARAPSSAVTRLPAHRPVMLTLGPKHRGGCRSVWPCGRQ